MQHDAKGATDITGFGLLGHLLEMLGGEHCASLELASLDYKRSKQLYEDLAISESEFETSLTNYNTALAEKEAAEFSVQSAKATLDEADESLTKTSIYAPMEGTVSSLSVELGERVVGTSMMSGTEMLRIADLNRMEVEVEVNENVMKIDQNKSRVPVNGH